jgi:hypothetical protein
MSLARILSSLAIGVLATVAGFRLIFLTAPVWVASFIVAKSGLHATHATLNLTYLATNILFWAAVAYVALTLLSKRKRPSVGPKSAAE